MVLSPFSSPDHLTTSFLLLPPSLLLLPPSLLLPASSSLPSICFTSSLLLQSCHSLQAAAWSYLNTELDI